MVKSSFEFELDGFTSPLVLPLKQTPKKVSQFRGAAVLSCFITGRRL